MLANHVLKILLLFPLLCLPCQTTAQIDWLRAARGALRAGQAYMMDDELLAEEAHKQVAAMDRQAKVAAAGNKYAVRLQRITKGLQKADDLELNFKVYITTEVNAFACPDGSVRVYSALMDALTDNELLGVIGHEIGHVALHHTLKAWKEKLYRGAASDALGVMSDNYASISDSQLGALAGAALSARFSKQQELEADDYGYVFLKKNGKNPWAMALMFEKLQKISEKPSSNNAAYKKLAQWLQVFSTHPDFDERINRMKRAAKKDGIKPPK